MGKDSGSGAKVHWNQTNLAYSVITIGVPMGEEEEKKEERERNTRRF